jgi:hypothetical protein
LEDQESEVFQLINANKTICQLSELNTQPSVYYI